jgi:hypothetical protein
MMRNMSFLAGAALAASLAWILGVSTMEGASAPATEIPAFTAYSEPEPDAIEFSEEGGVTGWKEKKDRIVWYGELKSTGRLSPSVRLRLPAPDRDRFRLSVSRVGSKTEERGTVAEAAGGADPVTVPFGERKIASPGYYRFALEGESKTGETFGEPVALLLSGPAAEGAHFNLKPRRNAASVHLFYPVPPDEKIAGFYNVVTARADPLWSYYMACGFSRGYFGMQVNSPTERRIIFSVWDSGEEPVDRGKVKPEDRVQLLAKGEGVVAESFGNEGTGGHSHLVYPWKKGVDYRFYVTAQPDGSATIYSGYFYFPEKKAWGLIARFRAPKDGGYLRGLYSFNENFGGANGQLLRKAEFGPGWVKSDRGAWNELTEAKFSHDGTGKEDRKDYDAGAIGDRFYLSNGGFRAGSIQYGDEIRRPSSGSPPRVETP